MKKARFKIVDEYFAAFPDSVRNKLAQIRQIVRKEAPDAKEVISYNMPAYKFNGMLLYFAAHKEHIGFYPFPSAINAFKKNLSAYETSKGGIRFPFDKPIPKELIRKIVKFRIKENLRKLSK